MTVAVADPSDEKAVNDLRQQVGLPVKIIMSTPTQLLVATMKAFEDDFDTPPLSHGTLNLDSMLPTSALAGALLRSWALLWSSLSRLARPTDGF